MSHLSVRAEFKFDLIGIAPWTCFGICWLSERAW